MEPVLVVPKWMPYYPTLVEKINAYTTRFTIISGAKEVCPTPITSTPSELVVNTSVECITTSSRILNGTKVIITKLFSMLTTLVVSFVLFFWNRIDTFIKTHILLEKKKRKKNKKDQRTNIDEDNL